MKLNLSKSWEMVVCGRTTKSSVPLIPETGRKGGLKLLPFNCVEMDKRTYQKRLSKINNILSKATVKLSAKPEREGREKSLLNLPKRTASSSQLYN